MKANSYCRHCRHAVISDKPPREPSPVFIEEKRTQKRESLATLSADAVFYRARSRKARTMRINTRSIISRFDKSIDAARQRSPFSFQIARLSHARRGGSIYRQGGVQFGFPAEERERSRISAFDVGVLTFTRERCTQQSLFKRGSSGLGKRAREKRVLP